MAHAVTEVQRHGLQDVTAQTLWHAMAGVSLPLYGSDRNPTGEVALGAEAVNALKAGFGRGKYRQIHVDPALAMAGTEKKDALAVALPQAIEETKARSSEIQKMKQKKTARERESVAR